MRSCNYCRPARHFAAGVLLFGLITALSASAQNISVVSAASYQAAIAPSSLASIFGSGLATSKASASLDSNGQLPNQLAGTSVELNGETVPLLYASPSQINFLVPDDATTGVAEVVVNTSLGATLRGSVLVNSTAPALFAIDASGKGPGAILNAVTFAPPPFLVETPENTGDDKRTRIAVYATGIRWAGNPSHDPSITNAPGVTVQAHDAAGNSYSLEYAGAAPGFFGLDQVNLVLPAELDGAGVVSMFVNTDDGSSNAVTAQVQQLSPSAIRLAALSLSSAFVLGGATLQGKVSLNGRAPFAGTTIGLRSSNAAVLVPISVSIPQGKTSNQFVLSTTSVNTTQTATITAQGGGVSQTADLEIAPMNTAQLQSLSAGVQTIIGGATINLTATLSAPAPLGGATVQLAATGAAITLPDPATLMIPFGQSSASVKLPTAVVSNPTVITVTATLGHAAQQTTVTLNPPFTVALADTSVPGGNGSSAVLTAGGPAPGNGLTLFLKSTDAAVQLPSSVRISPGQTTVTVAIKTLAVTTVHNASIVVSSPAYPNFAQTVALSVIPTGSVQLSSITLSQQVVTGGSPLTGTVALTGAAPPGGVSVILKSSDPHAQVPFVAMVPAAQMTAVFVITTAPVSAATTATITATAAGVSQSAVLKIR